ncbi:DUF4214 domain-containing protein [Christensenella tenuis]|uniref:DUF4214 domain-containing protein n=1 Tax=Christensenella tenuis TaxID=2763033 RepID=A0ABR7EDM6_9FIRM|nr:DUF4214 domain-containing protein [Christensenella tenuis]MBC5647879.1 DUF4214 domain-containing protein [Christensenella tenuis]
MKKIVAFIVVALMLVSSVAFAAEAPMTEAESSAAITEATAETSGENVDAEPSSSAEPSMEPSVAPSAEPTPDAEVEQHEVLETLPSAEIEERVDGPNGDMKDGFQPAEKFVNVDAEALQVAYDQTKADEQSMAAQDYHLIVNQPLSGKTYYTGADIYTEAEMYDCYGWYYGIIVYKDGNLYDIVTGNNFIKVSGTQTYYGDWDTSGYAPGSYEMVAVVTTGLDFSGTLMYTAHSYITLLEPTAIKSFVTRMYQTVLGRNPDNDGLAFWTKNLVKGKNTGVDLAYSFFFSTEMNKKNLSDSAFIEALYKAVFGRSADPSGKAYWQGLLDKGCSRKAVPVLLIQRNIVLFA